MTLTLAYSQCPNDTFIFDALVHQKVDTEGLCFEVHLHDVEELNRNALSHKFQISKVSFHAFLYLFKEYALLNSGAALGQKCGPLLITSQQYIDSFNSNSRVAIPGKYTTANSLFYLAYPNHKNTSEMLFSEIEDAILKAEVDAGVIIHENRFTYQDKGLKKIIDLGEFWEEKTQLPIPLGGIVVSKSLNKLTQNKIQRVLRRSIEFALSNPNQAMGYVKENSQEIDIEVIKSHIKLYVNNYSLDLGVNGRKAVQYMFKKHKLSFDELQFI